LTLPLMATQRRGPRSLKQQTKRKARFTPLAGRKRPSYAAGEDGHGLPRPSTAGAGVSCSVGLGKGRCPRRWVRAGLRVCRSRGGNQLPSQKKKTDGQSRQVLGLAGGVSSLQFLMERAGLPFRGSSAQADRTPTGASQRLLPRYWGKPRQVIFLFQGAKFFQKGGSRLLWGRHLLHFINTTQPS